MNCYASTLNALGLARDSHGEHSWMYLMLSALAAREAADPQVNTYGTPVRETIHRLAVYDCPAYRALRARLATALDREARR